MGGTSSFFDRWKYIIVNDRKIQLKYAASLFLFFSLLFSMGNGIIYSIGWISMGLMGLTLLYKRVPRFFFISLWLGLIYILIFTGVNLSFNYSDRFGSWFMGILGYSILAGSFILVLYLIIYIKDKRDEYALEGEYVPIGLFFLFVIAFFWTSFFAIIGWVRWADYNFGHPALYKALYFTAELILIPIFVHIITFPEDKFRSPVTETEIGSGTIINQLKDFFRSATGNRLKEDEKVRKVDIDISCPLCNNPLERNTRDCPTCGTKRFFYWCGRSEEYFVRCPNCRNLTPLGRQRCIHCSIKMSSKVKCSRCNSIHRVSEWTNH